MGKVEKVIVLSVLFLIALILVVSLTVDDPLDKTRVVEAGTTPNGHVVSPTPAPNPGPSDPKLNPAAGAPGLISMPIETGGKGPSGNDQPTTPPAATPPPANGAAGAASPVATNGLPAGALLKKLDGLQDSILTDMKLYTWKEGDSYRLIANNYYGDWNKFTVLRRSNEGRTDVHPGDQIFVPVFDSDPTVAAAPTPPAVAPKGPKVAAATDKAAKKATAPKASPSGKKVHVVKNGESLWKIAHQELGDGGRWKEIYALNKDVLPSESSVHAGQTLRIP